MAISCTRCGGGLVGGRFCLDCGAEQTKMGSRENDPCVGRLLGDRYEVGELIGVGGMGRFATDSFPRPATLPAGAVDPLRALSDGVPGLDGRTAARGAPTAMRGAGALTERTCDTVTFER